MKSHKLQKSFSQRMFISKSHCPVTKEDDLLTKIKNSSPQHSSHHFFRQNSFLSKSTTKRFKLAKQLNLLEGKKKTFEEIEFPHAKAQLCLKGKVSMFAHNSFKGRQRNYNEDRIAIECNIQRPKGKKTNRSWPRIDYFAVFDGHGGEKSSEYLQKDLLSLIVNDISFPDEPIKAMKTAFAKADAQLLKEAMLSYETKHFDRSGSCAIVVLIIRDMVYCANVGDSRSIYSENYSQKVKQLSIEHKPNINEERERILSAGGSLFKTETTIDDQEVITWRIIPGELAVSRSLGDVESKLPYFGGNPCVLISSPDITSFQLNEMSDFIAIGSDGIFDNLSNKDIIKDIWRSKREKERRSTHSNKQLIGDITDSTMYQAMNKGSNDNVSFIFIAFTNFFKSRDEYYSPLKYIDQVNCEQTLQKNASFNKKEGEEEEKAVHPLFSRIRKKPKTHICFNATLNKFYISNKLKKKEETLILNSCQSQKAPAVLIKKYQLPLVRSRLVN